MPVLAPGFSPLMDKTLTDSLVDFTRPDFKKRVPLNPDHRFPPYPLKGVGGNFLPGGKREI